MLTKWWKSELMLATNFGSLCPEVTNFGSQNFGYQIWFCTRLLKSVRLSVCPFVRLSNCYTFFTMFLSSYHHEIYGVITIDKSDVHAKDQGQRSKVKVKEVKTQPSRFRTVTPVWIHIWWWNDGHSLMLLRRDALLFFKVIYQISRSHWTKKTSILTGIEKIVFQGHLSNFKVTRL